MKSLGTQETVPVGSPIETVSEAPQAAELTRTIAKARLQIGLEELSKYPLRRVRTQTDTGLSVDALYFAVPIDGTTSVDLYDDKGNLVQQLVREQSLAPTLDELKAYPPVTLTPASINYGLGEGPYHPFPCTPRAVDLYDMTGKLVAMYVNKDELK